MRHSSLQGSKYCKIIQDMLEFERILLISALVFCKNGAEILGWRQSAAGPSQHIQVRAGKQHIQAIQVFAQYPVNCFPETKDVFYDAVRMLHFTANRGFLVLNLSIPIDGIV